MGLRPALKLCNPILHRHPPRFSSLPPLILRRKPAGGGRRSPPPAEQRGALFSLARAGNWRRGTPAPHPRLRVTCEERSRLKSGGGGFPRPPTPRSPLSTAKAGDSGGGDSQTCQPGDCPSHGNECRSCVRGERSVPKLRRCPGGWMRTAPLAAPQRLLPNSWGAGFSRGKWPAGNRALGEQRRTRREVGGREKGDRARGACCFPAQKRSEGESSTERSRFSRGGKSAP